MKNVFAIVIALLLIFEFQLPAFANKNFKETTYTIVANTQAKKVVAVYDFTNNTGDPSYEYLKDGIPDSMLTGLVSNANNNFTVVERGQFKSIMKEFGFSNTGFVDINTATKVGNALGATHVVVGGITKAGGVFRLNVRVIDVKTSMILFAFSEAASQEKNLFNLVDNASFKISDKLVGKSESFVEDQVANNQVKKSDNVIKPNNNEIKRAEYSNDGADISGAWVLSIFIPGLGQMALAEFVRGLFFLIIESLMVSLTIVSPFGLLGYLAVYIWNVTDAYSIAYDQSLPKNRLSFRENSFAHSSLNINVMSLNF